MDLQTMNSLLHLEPHKDSCILKNQLVHEAEAEDVEMAVSSTCILDLMYMLSFGATKSVNIW